MKVSKRQLRRIIREERRILLNEIKDGRYTVNGEPFSDLADAKEEAEYGGFDVIDTSSEEVVYSPKEELEEISALQLAKDGFVEAMGTGCNETLRRRVRRSLREVEYHMDRDPVGRFETELASAWDSAVGQGAMESELSMTIEDFLTRRGFL